ncbi:MAG: DUF364 domain-containing protein [Deltaproteobacteria bacterium]
MGFNEHGSTLIHQFYQRWVIGCAMGICEKIKEHLTGRAEGAAVKEVRIGLGYTAVMLKSGQTGVAFTFSESMQKGCTVFVGRHPLAGRDALELLSYMGSKDRIETAVALATANALANATKEGLIEGDTMAHLRIDPEDTVGMVGYFGPVLPRLKKKTKSILIFEESRSKEKGVLPAEEAYRLLPQCQVAMITSTSIVNHTIDSLLEVVGSCRDVVLLGASTPLVPEVFEHTPVTFLSGVIVTRPEEILRIVSEAGGMHFFKDNVKKVNCLLRKVEQAHH